MGFLAAGIIFPFLPCTPPISNSPSTKFGAFGVGLGVGGAGYQ